LKNILSLSTHLTTENGQANISATLIGNFGTESITVNDMLEYESRWIIWGWENTHNMAHGFDYCFTLAVTVFRNDVTETITASRATRTKLETQNIRLAIKKII